MACKINNVVIVVIQV